MNFVWFIMNVHIVCKRKDIMKPGLKRLVVEMAIEDYKIVKKLAVDKNCTIKVVVIDALEEYAIRQGMLCPRKI
jgi:hypothetical protein